MAGQLSYTQSMWVRSPFHSGRRLTNVPRTFSAPQLRSCFSGVTVAQLICNQPVVGSNPTGSFYMQVSRNWLTHRFA